MKKIAITGLSGVIGERFIKNLPPDIEIYDLYHTRKASIQDAIHKHIELLNPKSINKCLEAINPDTVIHMASITHIDRCEEESKKGKDSDVWKVNVDSSDTISKYCKKNGADLIFLSTECVFDGEKSSYNEKSLKNPKNWYGKTKSEAEDIIRSNFPKASVVRAVIAYHENDFEKTLFGKLLKLFKDKKSFGAVTDQRITPTYTDDIIKAIFLLLKNPQSGIFHIAPETSTTIYDFALRLAEQLDFDKSFIIGQTLEEYFGTNRAKLRLKNSCLNGEWTKSKLNFTPLTIDDVLGKIIL